MALGLDAQVFNHLVSCLDTVFHKEAVPGGVVGDIVFDAQVIRAMYGHAAVVGIVNRRIFNVLSQPHRH